MVSAHLGVPTCPSLNPALSESESRVDNISFNVIICHKQHQMKTEVLVVMFPHLPSVSVPPFPLW